MSVCLSVCLSVVSYARPHLWADLDETLQGDPEVHSDGHGGIGCGTIHTGSPGWGHNFKKAVVDVATVEFICFLCRCKDNYVYTFAAGCLLDCCQSGDVQQTSTYERFVGHEFWGIVIAMALHSASKIIN